MKTFLKFALVVLLSLLCSGKAHAQCSAFSTSQVYGQVQTCVVGATPVSQGMILGLNSSVQVIPAPVSLSGGIFGVALQSGSPGSTVLILISGQAGVSTDNACAFGQLIIVSTSVAGNGHCVTSTASQYVGTALTGTPAAGSTMTQVSALSSGTPGTGTASSSSPAVLINQSVDVFNRTGANLGANWTQYLNTISTTPGAAVGGSAALYNVAAWTATTTVPTQSVRCSFPTVGTDQVGCAVRISGTPGTSASFYECIENTTQVTLQKIVGATPSTNGTSTLLGSQARAAVAGDSITISVIGNTITCSVNSAAPMVANDASSPLTAGLPGVVFFGNVSAVGSWTLVNPALPAGALANIVFDGDSILAANGNGSPLTDPATSFLYLATTPAYVTNLGVSAKCLGIGCAAVSGGTIESMLSTGTSVVDTLFVPGVKNILVIFGGTNDIMAARTPAQVNTDLTTYVTARHAAGWKVITVPPLSRATTALPLSDEKEAILASLIQANTAGADAVVTLPISLISPGGSLNTTLFNADQVHPTEITHIDIFARAFIAALSKF